MKIAVAAEEKKVAPHFGHCQEFMIFETEGEKIISQEVIANPGHQKHGFLPEFLHEKGIGTVIAGSMGQGALDIFASHGIKAITGAVGDACQAAQDYLMGKLVSKNVICQHHGHCQHH